jgi:hypothetical protein
MEVELKIRAAWWLDFGLILTWEQGGELQASGLDPRTAARFTGHSRASGLSLQRLDSTARELYFHRSSFRHALHPGSMRRF